MPDSTYLKAPLLTPGQDAPENAVNLLAAYFDKAAAQIGALISGLQLEWVSASSIKVKKGVAALPGGGLVVVAADITKTGISLGANAWGHVYLYDNAGAAAVEVVTTAPSNYFSTAYQKTSDATRRYLGSVRTDGSGNILNFAHDPQTNFVRYLTNIADTNNLTVLNAGTASTETTVGCTAAAPVTSNRILIRFDCTVPNTYAVMGNSIDSVTPPTSGIMFVNPSTSPIADMPLDNSQAFTYRFNAAPSSGALYGQMLGYYFKR